MKFIKNFENTNINIPKVGDYVICQEKKYDKSDISDFLKNNIGQIICSFENSELFSIKYSNIPDDLKFFFKKNCRGMFINEIKYYSKNKKDLEIYITANKYNL